MLSLFAFRQIAELTPFSPKISILGVFNCHHPFWFSKGTSDPTVERKFSIGSSPLTFLNDPDIPTPVHRSSPDISFAPGRCFRTWALIIYQFYLSLICFSAQTNGPLLTIFRKLIGMSLLFTSTITVLLLLLSASPALNAAKCLIPFARVKHKPQAW